MPEADVQKLFGTDGIRGVAGRFPLDDKTVRAIARSLVSNLRRELGRAPSLVIGRDTRESGPAIERALTAGALSAGASVQSSGVITTPGVAYVTRVTPFDAGVVISASHNPYRDNGIKVFSPSGKKLPDEMERRIEEDLAQSDEPGEQAATPATGDDAEAAAGSGVLGGFQQKYLDYLAGEVAAGLRLDTLRIAVDCANGASSHIAPRLFERLGAGLHVLAASPNGRNINEGCGSLHLEGLQQAVRERGLDLGIAFDGDADRALFVDSAGEVVDGDAVLLLLGEFMKSRGALDHNIIVATVMSNIGLEIATRERGIGLVRTQVGDRYVLEELIARGAKLGGEQSGHIIFPDVSLAGDGMITAIQVLRAMTESGRGLGELASQMKRYPQVLVNVKVTSKPPLESLPEVRSAIEHLEGELQGRGRLLVRYSGTENLARVMIEGEDESEIQRQADHLAEVIRRAIG